MKIIGIVLIILGCIVGLLFLLLLLPARVRVAVKADELFLWAGLGPLMIRVLPVREKKPKKQKKKKQRKAPPDEAPVPQATEAPAKAPKADEGKAPTVSAQPEGGAKGKFSMPKFSVETIAAYCRLAVDAMGQMKRCLIIRRLEIHAVIATGDAAVTAMAYGSAAAAVNMLLPLLEENFRMRKKDIAVDCDFNRSEPTIDFTIELSAVVLPMLLIGMRVLRGFLKLNREMNEKAVQV